MPQIEAMKIDIPNTKELKAMGISPRRKLVRQHLIERASLITVLWTDKKRLATEIDSLRDARMPLQIQRRRALEIQEMGLGERLQRAILLEAS